MSGHHQRHPRRPSRAGLTALVAISVSLPAMAWAGTASYDGTGVRFVDSSDRANDVAVTLEQDADGARVGFLEYDPATVVGPGCVEGFVSTECATGAALPASISVDLGPGNDVLELNSDPVSSVRVVVLGGDGDDELRKVQTLASIDAGPGNDVIYPDHRYANNGVPQVVGGDVIAGGAGVDAVDYELVLDPVTVSLDGTANDGRPGELDNVTADVENLLGGLFDDRLTGSAGANTIDGRAGNDVLVGLGGRDDIAGGGGNDTVDALDGTGGDRVSCSDGADVAYVDARDAVDDTCERVLVAAAVSSRLGYSRSHVTARVSCPKGAGTCRGTVRITIAKKGKQIVVGSARYAVRAGKAGTVRASASARSRRVLEGSRKTRATIFVSPKGRDAVVGSSASIRG